MLQIDGLTVLFPAGPGYLHAVDEVSLSLEAGDTLGIVGESGSGKSVLARSVMRLTPQTALKAGSIWFDGRDLERLSNRAARSLWSREIAMVFQNPMTSLNPVMRIGRQIGESLRLHLGVSPAAAKQRARELLEMVGVPDAERRLRCYPQELSGGMRQRISIAIAIACSPKLLLADEPTTALDVTIQRQILDLLAELQQKQRMAMMVITHDFGVVARCTQRVMVMYAGQVVESAPTAQLFAGHRHPYTASLLGAIPRLEQPSHTRLAAIPGRPVEVLDPKPGCRFAPRCTRAQERCLVEDPPLVVAAGRSDHHHACFFPIGSAEGERAIEKNLSRGSSAAGLAVPSTSGAA